MRILGVLAVAVLAFGACELPRPEGAYNELKPMVPDGSLPLTEREEGGMPPPPPFLGGAQPGMQGGNLSGAAGGDLSGTAGGTQAGLAGGTDAGTGGVGGLGGTMDAGVAPLTPEQMALKSLEGRYLVRMDMFSTASVTQSLFMLSTSNRLSHLIATQLVVENGQLRGAERLCYQTFEHRCVTGCTSLATKMATVMTDWFVKMDYTMRNYVVSNGMLTGMSNTMPLGYDAKTDPRLPNIEDARVWDPVPGNAKREGLLLGLSLMSLVKNVKCDVYTTQTFVSRFGPAKLGGSSVAPTLEGVQFVLDTSGSDGATLGATSVDCEDDSGPAPVEGQQYVRFARLAPEEFGGEQSAEFWNCPPQDVWDSRLKPSAP